MCRVRALSEPQGGKVSARSSLCRLVKQGASSGCCSASCGQRCFRELIAGRVRLRLCSTAGVLMFVFYCKAAAAGVFVCSVEVCSVGAAQTV